MALDKLTSDMITAGAVNAAAIADGTVVAAEIAEDAITNANSISENITVPINTNAMSVGPMTLAVGNTITINGVYTVI